jgi:hypothetical protein
MYIEPIECKQCGRKGRPGEKGFRSSSHGTRDDVHCDCGSDFQVEPAHDQRILSGNAFVRLSAASNHEEEGVVTLAPGKATKVVFAKPFDFPCKAFLTPQGGPMLVKELTIRKDGMTLLSSVFPNEIGDASEQQVSWLVHGLVDIDKLPTWYVHFYSAITHAENGFCKPALLDYAVAFETFVETFLEESLRQTYGSQVAEYLLRRTWHIEDRVKELLELATGHRLSEREDVYQPWDKHVRRPRNDLSHGLPVSVNEKAVETAHQAVYQALRWIQDMSTQQTGNVGVAPI